MKTEINNMKALQFFTLVSSNIDVSRKKNNIQDLFEVCESL